MRYFAASSLPLRGKPTQAQEVARRISGAIVGEVRAGQDLTPDNEPFLAPLPGSLRKKSTYQVPITIPISRITLFAICLSFSFPPNSPLPFYSPSLSLSSLSICLFCPLAILSARVLVCLSSWLVSYLLRCLPRVKF